MFYVVVIEAPPFLSFFTKTTTVLFLLLLASAAFFFFLNYLFRFFFHFLFSSHAFLRYEHRKVQLNRMERHYKLQVVRVLAQKLFYMLAEKTVKKHFFRRNIHYCSFNTQIRKNAIQQQQQQHIIPNLANLR